MVDLYTSTHSPTTPKKKSWCLIYNKENSKAMQDPHEQHQVYLRSYQNSNFKMITEHKKWKKKKEKNLMVTKLLYLNMS